jgi:DNA adenine methylase
VCRSSLGILNNALNWNGSWIVAKPFFKWPGSKRWLITLLSNISPRNSLRLVEPFAGSAALYLGSSYQTGLLADTNLHVVSCLQAVRDEPKQVLKYLSSLQNTREVYLRVRAEMPGNNVSAAGRLIFLTNTSWGGLYRENQDGRFNVPFGNNGREFFCEKTVMTASAKLTNVEIKNWGFSQTLEVSTKKDLLFIDAPYVTKLPSEYFDRYHASKFSWTNQLALAKYLTGKKMATREVMVTCAADKDLYELFKGWRVFEFQKRNSMTAYRGSTGHRKEALLISPALKHFSDEIENNQFSGVRAF